MFIPGMQLKSIFESLESTKRCLPLFAEAQQDVYLVSHSPDGAYLSRSCSPVYTLITEHAVSDSNAYHWEEYSVLGYNVAVDWGW
jgi:hypothetical protein